MKDITIAVDIAKDVFEMALSHEPGVVKGKHRVTRKKLLSFFVNQPPATVVMEACGSAHHWAQCMPGAATTRPLSPSPTNSLALSGQCGNTTPSSSRTRRPPETASTCTFTTNVSDYTPSDENSRSNGTSVRPTRGQADKSLGHPSPLERLAPRARFPFWPGGERLIRAQPTPHTGRRYEC